MYFEDLSLYEYLNDNEEKGSNILNIGWLDKSEKFTKGHITPQQLSKIIYLCVINTVSKTRGYHVCPFCKKMRIGCPIKFNGQKYLLGDAEIRVEGKNGVIYAAPNLICHYIKKHHYLPPKEFLDAIDNLPKQQEYKIGFGGFFACAIQKLCRGSVGSMR